MLNLTQNKFTLIFSLLLNFVSCFGQTFFISLFVVHFLNKFFITESQFGLYYSLLTLSGGLVIPQVAKKLESLSWGKVSLLIPLVLSVCTFLVSISESIFLLIPALFGLRLFGQGLSGHMSAVCIVKNISSGRGTALSLSSIGYPLSEAIMPPLCYLLIMNVGLEKTWLSFSLALFIMTPFFFFLSKRIKNNSTSSGPEKSIPIKEVLKDMVFLKYLPAVLCAPFFMTGIFLYQSSISKMKDWPVEHLSLALSSFALSRFLFSLFSGPLIDKFSAIKLFKFYLSPLIVSLVLLATINELWVSWLFMFIAGISIGISGPIKSALWSELYGPELHGRYRSISSSFMVFSTAAAPFIFGHLIEHEVPLTKLLLGSALLIIAAISLTFLKNNKLPS